MYWQAQLAGDLPHYDHLYDHARVATALPRYQWQSFVVDPELKRRLEELARVQGVTLYVLLLSAFQILLFRYTGLEDVVVGSPTFGRTRAQFAGTVGNFVNVLALREQVTGAMSVQTVLDRTRRTVLEALDHQEYPFSLLATELRSTRDPQTGLTGQRTVCPATFSHAASARYRNDEQRKWSTGIDEHKCLGSFCDSAAGRAVQSLPQDDGVGRRGQWMFRISCRAVHFRIHRSHDTALPTDLGWDGGPYRPACSELSLMTDAERERVLTEFNGHAVHQTERRSIQRRFEDQAQKTPDVVAVMHDTHSVTYRELNVRSNQLAHYLCVRGVQPDVVVGICLERSIDLIVALLAVGKAGGAYLPLDPDYPVKRLEWIMDDARIRVLLTRTDLLARLPSAHPHTVCLDSEGEAIARLPETPPANSMTDRNLAYVIYTSGSTGEPKGVMIEHRSLVNYVEAISKHIGLRSDDRVLQFASIGFDTAAEEIFPCLLAGGTLVLRTSRMLDSMARFLDACHERQITVLDLPTAVWHELVARMETDALTLPLLSEWSLSEGSERSLMPWRGGTGWFLVLYGFVNTYRPTEATIAATLGDLVPSSIGIDSVPRGVDRVRSHGSRCMSLIPVFARMPVGRPVNCMSGVSVLRAVT